MGPFTFKSGSQDLDPDMYVQDMTPFRTIINKKIIIIVSNNSISPIPHII